MARFFAAAGNIAGGVACIMGEDAAHARVLRLRVGDQIVVCDGEGKDYYCHVTKLDKNEMQAEIFDTVISPAEPTVRVSVLAGLPKGERADYIIQKSTELGATDIAFFLCERCVARPETAIVGRKLTRWQRIAEEAAKQSGRGIIPKVRLIPNLAGALDVAVKTELPIFLYETGDRQPLKTAIENAGSFSSAAIITGPEGGFEAYEAELAVAAGLRCCSMGPRIYRCETAPVAALSVLMYATDNM